MTARRRTAPRGFSLPPTKGDRMRSKLFIATALFAALTTSAFALVAFAQAPQGQRINVRGTIAKLDGHILTVKTPDKGNVSVALAPHYMVRTLVRKKLSDIHPG